MARILIAWELGANYGHLARDLPIALRLRSAGHEVLFAVRDVRVAGELLARHDLPYCQCALPRTATRLAWPPANYAELLLADGYGDNANLSGMVQSWLGLLGLYKPELVIADHAPTALIACHVMAIPALPVGSGFEIPPDNSPMPSIRPWEEVLDERLHRAESVALWSINSVMAGLQGRPFGRIAELFGMGSRALMTFPEIDHYGARKGEYYVGPIYHLPHAEKVDWPAGDGKRIFAYLRPKVPGFEAAMKALSASEANVICVAPGLTHAQRAGLTRERFHVYERPLAIEHLLESADLTVTYGGAGTVAQSLLSGVPLLLLPNNVEQYLAALRVEMLGAGVALRNERSEDALRLEIGKVLDDREYRNRAEAFSLRHKGFRPEQAVEKVVELAQVLMLSKACAPFAEIHESSLLRVLN